MKSCFRILSVILAALLLSVGAGASPVIVRPRGYVPAVPKAEAPAPAEEPEKKPYLFTPPEGMKRMRVSSAMCFDPNRFDLEPVFDADRDTALKVAFGENEPRSFTLFMGTGVPQTLTGVAFSLAADKGTEVSVRLLATNDAAQKNWVPLTLDSEGVEEDGWKIVKTAEAEEKYAFYALLFTVTGADGFELREAALLKPQSEPEYRFASADGLEPGEMPEIIEIKEPEEETKDSLFPLYLAPFLSMPAR